MIDTVDEAATTPEVELTGSTAFPSWLVAAAEGALALEHQADELFAAVAVGPEEQGSSVVIAMVTRPWLDSPRSSWSTSSRMSRADCACVGRGRSAAPSARPRTARSNVRAAAT